MLEYTVNKYTPASCRSHKRRYPMEQATPKKRFPILGVIAIILVVLLLMAAAAYCGLCRWVRDNGRLLPGAYATDLTGVMDMNLDLGTLTYEDALKRLTDHMEDRLHERTLTLNYDDGKTAVLTGSLLSFDPVSAVDFAMTVKSAQPFLRLGALWMGVEEEPVDMGLSATALTPEGELQIQELIQRLTRELYIEPVDYTYAFNEEEEHLALTFGHDGRKILSDGLAEEIHAALASGQPELDVRTESIPSAELNVSMPREDGTLSPTKYGYGIDPEDAQALMDAYVPDSGPCIIPIIYYEPDITEAEPYPFQDLLATYTNQMDGVENRSHNVRRAADFCNEYVMLPTDIFSYIGIIGNPSLANGYKTSTGYQGGQTVEMAGGGVCQVSSSIYYCAVYSNLEIVHRAAHAFTPTYVPYGLDATMYFPSLDFKFRNNTDYPIKIVTSYTEGAWGYLTVSIYGTKADDTYVDTEINTLSVTPWETKYQPNPDIPMGTTSVKVTPYTGYVVEVYRLVYDGDGTLLSRTYENKSRYAKRDKVIEFNPADAARLGLYPDGTPIPVPESTPPASGYDPMSSPVG